ncbi:MAG: hypothetical protein VZT48_08955 [Bulleidia sp.]|nr:hypothetical protein [Bulleidia sp.]
MKTKNFGLGIALAFSLLTTGVTSVIAESTASGNDAGTTASENTTTVVDDSTASMNDADATASGNDAGTTASENTTTVVDDSTAPMNDADATASENNSGETTPTAAPTATPDVSSNNATLDNAGIKVVKDKASPVTTSKVFGKLFEKPADVDKFLSDAKVDKSQISTDDPLTITETFEVEEVKDDNASDNVLTFNVEPVLEVKNSKVDVTVQNETVSKAYERSVTWVTLTVGNTFAEGTAVAIDHYKDNDKVYHYGSVVKNGEVTFENPDGFSTFSVYPKPAPAPKPETKKSTSPAVVNATNTVVTCEQAGYGKGSYWNEATMSCVVPKAPTSAGTRPVPNTADR